MFWKASVLEKTEGNKDFSSFAKLKVIPGKPSVLSCKNSKLKENRTEGNKGTRNYDGKNFRKKTAFRSHITTEFWTADSCITWPTL